MTPLERMARAMQESPVECCSISDEQALVLARAALTAIRQPDVGMLVACNDAIAHLVCLVPSGITDAIGFTAMIDHVLKEGEG
jgi:hypothetical protein